jgi:hypothetical protein
MRAAWLVEVKAHVSTTRGPWVVARAGRFNCRRESGGLRCCCPVNVSLLTFIWMILGSRRDDAASS